LEQVCSAKAGRSFRLIFCAVFQVESKPLFFHESSGFFFINALRAKGSEKIGRRQVMALIP
jgi:hypothetical protein